MYTADHTLTTLFLQLGLDNSEHAIAEFIRTHPISHEESIEKAQFWTASQAQFIRESWHEDADWAVVIDQLDSLLRC